MQSVAKISAKREEATAVKTKEASLEQMLFDASKHYRNLNLSTNKPRRGITRAEAYVARIFPYEYDLEEMLIAFGVKQITETLIELHNNLKEGKRYKDRHKTAKKIRDRVKHV